MKMDHHISELLFCYDCVIIPEFGGFVANYQPARLDKVKQVLHPPSKGILFNKNLTHNDGLLANEISKVREVPYDQASSIIREYVQECRFTLDSGQRIEIDQVGILYFDHERNIQFQADESRNFLMESYGLSSIYVPPVVQKVVEKKETIVVPTEPVVKEDVSSDVSSEALAKEEVTKVIPLEPVVKEEKPEPVAKPEPKTIPIEETETRTASSAASQEEEEVKKRAWGWYVAAAVLLPIVFYSVWIPTQTDAIDTGHIQMSDFNPFRSDTAPAYTFDPEMVPEEFTLLGLDVDPFEGVTETTVELDFTEDGSLTPITVLVNPVHEAEAVTTYVDPTTDVNTNTYTDTKMYFIIGGCFQYLENAEGLVMELKQRGFDSYIVDQNKGLHRVCYGSYPSRKEAEAALPEIQATENTSAWILKKSGKK